MPTTTRSQAKTPPNHNHNKNKSKTTSATTHQDKCKTQSKTNNNNNNDNNNNNNNDWSSGDGLIPGRELIGPLFLMLTTPVFSIVFYHVVRHLDGDFVQFATLLFNNNHNNDDNHDNHSVLSTLYSIWPSPWNPTAWKLILSFLSFQLVLQKYLPGKTFYATMTPHGNIPVYKANGMLAYTITLLTLLTLTYFDLFQPYMVYDTFGHILSTMNVLAYVLCTILYSKGWVAPSTTDSGTSGNVVTDFFWGMELYPNMWGWDVKMFTNCRAGMMFWAVGIVCFAHKNMHSMDTSSSSSGGIHQPQPTLSYGMAVNVVLQLIYISKFFYWEMGYMCSMDIQHDRAGYYLCWGCLVWVPSVYTSHSFYLAEHAPDLSLTTALLLLLCGSIAIFVNYDSDNQRYVFRQTHGNCLLWGKKPRYLVATYETTNTNTNATTTTKQSLLLLDGWWRVSRHFHYVPEILASLFWSLPALFDGSSWLGPYFYVVYLTILLTDRAFRDDDRCRKKYGATWDDYCAIVPYKIVPGVV